ncbi:MAG: hypothetical protein ACRCUM_03870 [Mycoplasmoidaceae bacterium]
MSKEIEKITSLSVSLEETNPTELVDRVVMIKLNGQAIKNALTPGINGDYAIIPGTGKKPSLLQPGADKILMLYGLSFEYNIQHKEIVKKTFVDAQTGETREVELGWRIVVEVRITHRDTGKFVSNGFGGFDPLNKRDAANALNFDTALKIAQKRAKVWTVKSIGGLSDIFNDDLSEIGGDVITCISKKNQITIYNELYKLTGKKDTVKEDINKVIDEWNKVQEIKIPSLNRMELDIFEEFLQFMKDLLKKGK